jgi:Protein of unknown function (DUF1566)
MARRLAPSLLTLFAGVLAGAGCRGPAVQPGATTPDAPVASSTAAKAEPSGPAARPTATAGSPSSVAAGAASWARWPMPNPASTRLPNPASYDTSSADVVVDRVTGLIWQRRITQDGLLWQEAIDHCAALRLAGAADWRLPSLIELISIDDFTRVVPAVDKTAFPDAVQGNFWTSTPVAAADGEAWYVAFSTGFTYQGHQSFLRIGSRCVRAPAHAAGADQGHHLDLTPTTVHDAQTGLTWQRNIETATTYAWADAANHCRSLRLEGGGWRVPSVKELHTLINVSRQAPALDLAAFPGAPMEQHWTSSPLAGSSTDAWYVSFRLGTTNTIARDSQSFVRCVR